ncbi:MAG: rod shape-determining protein, partial [Thermosulfidibacteraceae bacterium]
AVGREAKVMWGRSPKHIDVINPINDGVIDHYDATYFMLRNFFNKAGLKLKTGKVRMVMCIPSKVTQVEKSAVVDIAHELGAKEVLLIDEPMAAAIGAGIPIHEPRGNMVVDIGGGTTDIAVISMGGISVKDSIRVAGNELDEAIRNYVRDKYNLLIGWSDAENVKISIGSATPEERKGRMVVGGRDLASGTPKEVEITSEEVWEAVSPYVETMVDAVRRVLDITTPELVSDIAKNGVYLTGGGSLLHGLDRFMERKIKVKVVRVSNPLEVVVLGAGKALEEYDNYRNAFV